jgi:TPR repeat protein
MRSIVAPAAFAHVVALLASLSICNSPIAEAQTEVETERVRSLRVAAEAGDAEAQYQLSSELGGTGTDKARAEADKWLRASADSGYPRGQFILAMKTSASCGLTTRECPEAVSLLRRAADQDLAVAQFMLGQYYLEGRVVNEDRVAAFYAFQRAASLGHAAAARQLGLAYRDGSLVAVNLVESYKWFVIAVRRYDVSESNALNVNAYVENRDDVADRLTKEQLLEADKAVQVLLDALDHRRH